MRNPIIFLTIILLAGSASAELGQAWSYNAVLKIKSMDSLGSNAVLLSEDNTIIYLTRGTKNWSRGINEPLNTITLFKRIIIATSTDEKIYAFGLNGSLLWEKQIGTSVGFKDAIFADDYIVVGGMDGIIRVFDLNGELLWNRTVDSYVSNVRVINKTFVVVSDKQVYDFDVNGNEIANLGVSYYIRSSSISDDGVAVGLGDGTLQIYKGGTKTGEYQIGDQIGTIAIMDGYVAAGSRNENLYLFGKNATLIWNRKLDSAVTSVGVSGRNVYALTLNGGVYVYTTSGYLQAFYNDSGRVISSEISSDPNVLTISRENGKVISFELPSDRIESFGIFTAIFVISIILISAVVLFRALKN